MDAKGDGKERDSEDYSDSKGYDMYRGEGKGEDLYYGDDSKGLDPEEIARMEVLSVDTGKGAEVPIQSPLELKIIFSLDRDVVAGFWIIKLLVDSTDARIIKVLGETAVEDFMEGENEIYFKCESIDVTDISPSVLTNSGLLIASFMADGQEVAAINCVVNVSKNSKGILMREIYDPLG